MPEAFTSYSAVQRSTFLFSGIAGLLFLTVLITLAEISYSQNIESSLEILDIENGKRIVVHRDTIRFEAPNWTPNGKTLIFNQRGSLFRIPVEGGEPVKIPAGFATAINNDHGISADGTQLAISHHAQGKPAGANSTIYIMSVGGGIPRQITEKAPSYWHGWSPDGTTLVYTAERNGQFDIYSIPVRGGEETRLTNTTGLDDGPEYSPDGRFIYFNSERTGSMEIWRMNTDGSNPVQITDDSYNNWFPHPSPDGKYLVFLTYLDPIDPGSHPADKNVILRLMNIETGSITELARFTGGQGTINVPSWAPDSRRFAFVSYKRRD